MILGLEDEMPKEHGFTILEALISMAVFAVAMLAVIGLQIHAIQTDANTVRKDAAVQLLSTGVELVECAGFDDSSVFKTKLPADPNDDDNDEQKAFAYFKQSISGENDTDPGSTWKSSHDKKADLYLRYTETSSSASVSLKTVYLVASWRDVGSGDAKVISRVVTKPDNFIQ